jgi:predicted ATP-grasp superfamily ATP-dependent carboligase
MYCLLLPFLFKRKTFDLNSIIKYEFHDLKIIYANYSHSTLSNIKSKIIYGKSAEILRFDNKEIFCKDMLDISCKYQSEKIIFLPTEELYIDYFYHFISIHGNLNFLYLLPKESFFTCFRNKSTFANFCLDNGFNVPNVYRWREIILKGFDSFPIIFKPHIGSGSSGIRKVYSYKELDEELLLSLKNNTYIAQDLLPEGKDVIGAFFLCNNGNIVSSYCHKRIRTSPPDGGITVFSVIHQNEDVVTIGSKLLKLADWSGLVMLEFLYDKRDKKYKLIEANPRIWGSIMLSEYSNANLLMNYILLCMDQKTIKYQVKKNICIRWLFPVDLLNYLRLLGKIDNFWDFKNTCFINWTYTNHFSAFFFNILSLFDMKNFQRFFKK